MQALPCSPLNHQVTPFPGLLSVCQMQGNVLNTSYSLRELDMPYADYIPVAAAFCSVTMDRN
jgi:hypothetical protein